MTEERDEGRQMRNRLASGALVIKNAAITIGAQALMVVIGLMAVPILIDRLGTARFGILTLAWVIIGYANVFDLGLGRALTKLTAERLGSGKVDEIPRLFWTAVFLLTLLGIFAGALIVGLSTPLAYDWLEIPEHLRGEARATFILLGCTVPLVLVSAALRGSLEARQRFDLTNAVAVPLSTLSYFGPVVMSFFTDDLTIAVSAVAASRVIATAVNLFLCLRVDPSLKRDRQVDRKLAVPLLRFGGWVTLAAIVTPMMLTFDRFIIGALVSATAVAYYATPYEVSKQMLLISGAFNAVLFPGFAANVKEDPEQTHQLFSRGARAVYVGLFPITLIVSVLAEEILALWINQEFATNGGPVLTLLAASMLVNGLAFVAYALIQSIRPDLIAKIACVELPLYLGTFWLLLSAYGIRGAAIAFALRVVADTAALYWFTNRLKLVPASILLSIVRLVSIGVATIAVGVVLPSTALQVAYVAAVLVAFAPVAWRRILSDQERDRVRERVAAARASLRARRGATSETV